MPLRYAYCFGICVMSSNSQDVLSTSSVEAEVDLRASPAAPSSPLEFTSGTMEEQEAEVPEAENANDGSKPADDRSPNDQIEEFQWRALEDRYDSKMDECGMGEEHLFREFAGLIAVIQLGRLTLDIGFLNPALSILKSGPKRPAATNRSVL
jgi:hypothetical protein